jgi:hypothetical protein
MKRYLLTLAATLSLAGCAAGYTRADYVYAEPVDYEYVVPVDRVVVVTRDVLITRGWTVYRVERSGPNRIIWARRGDDQIVRIFATPRGDRGKHKGWAKRGEPRDIITDIDVRLKARG